MSNEQQRRPLSLKRATPAAETATPAVRASERLHKVLAQAGLGSRRALEQRIADGKVLVNGEIAAVGMSIAGGDKIEIDGKTLPAAAALEARAG